MFSAGIRSIIDMKSHNFCDIFFKNGKTVQNAKDIATIFNQYFVNIGNKIDSGIPRTRKFLFIYLGRKLMDPHFFVIPTNLAEIASIISRYKNRNLYVSLAYHIT